MSGMKMLSILENITTTAVEGNKVKYKFTSTITTAKQYPE
jgi:hypothetical protein